MKRKKATTKPAAIVNRRARFDYQLSDELTVGIVLSGPEVRAARNGHVQLKGAFVSVKNGELWLNNASFSVRLNQRGEADARAVDTSARKLLAHRSQIDALMSKKQSGMTIMPLKLLTHSKHIKLVIALGKGKKHHDKRETIKRRDQAREAAASLKRYEP